MALTAAAASASAASAAAAGGGDVHSMTDTVQLRVAVGKTPSAPPPLEPKRMIEPRMLIETPETPPLPNRRLHNMQQQSSCSWALTPRQSPSRLGEQPISHGTPARQHKPCQP